MKRKTILAIILMSVVIVSIIVLFYTKILPISFFITSSTSYYITVYDEDTGLPMSGVTVAIEATDLAFHFMGDVCDSQYINGVDGVVGGYDGSFINMYVGSNVPEGLWDNWDGTLEGITDIRMWCDLNKDYVVDGADKSIASANQGLTKQDTKKIGVTDSTGTVIFTDVIKGVVPESLIYKVTIESSYLKEPYITTVRLDECPKLYIDFLNPPIVSSISASSSVQPFEIDVAITFTATASDSDGSIKYYEWDFGDGQTSTAGASVTHTYSECGTYTVTCTAVDNDDLTGENSISIRITSKPVAKISSSASMIQLGSSVTFSSEGSYDPDGGDIISYMWNFGDGVTQTTTEPTVTHSYSQPNVYSVTVTVEDDEGQKSSASLTVTVKTEPGQAEFTWTPTYPYVDEQVLFDASNSKPSSGATITSYQWNFGDGYSISVSSPTVTHVYSSTGDYNVILTVVDSFGSQYTMSSTITVINHPQAYFVCSGEFIVNKPVVFDASSSTGESLSYKWYIDGNYVGDGAVYTYTFTSSGTYTVKLDVIDIRGTTDSYEQTINIQGELPNIQTLTILEFPPSSRINVKLLATSPSTGEPMSGVSLTVTIQQKPEGYAGSTGWATTDSSGVAIVTLTSPPSSQFSPYNMTVTVNNKIVACFDLKVLPQLLVKITDFNIEQQYKPGDYDLSYSGLIVDKETNNPIYGASAVTQKLIDPEGNEIPSDFTYWEGSGNSFTFKAKVFDYFKSINPDFNYERKTLTLYIVFKKEGYIDGVVNTTVTMVPPELRVLVTPQSMTVGTVGITLSFQDKEGNPYSLSLDQVEVLITTPEGKTLSTRNELKDKVLFFETWMRISYTFDEIGTYKITVRFYDTPFPQNDVSYNVNVSEASMIPPILTNPYVIGGIVFFILIIILLRRRKS